MQQTYPILVNLFLILAYGCAASPRITQEDMTVPPLTAAPSSESSTTPTAAPLLLVETPKSTPKQNDLIFIEFFAGT